MENGFGLSDNPRDFRRCFPAWFHLHHTIAEPRWSRRQISVRVGCGEEFISSCEKNPPVVRSQNGLFSIYDAITLAIIHDNAGEQGIQEFLRDKIWDFEEYIWLTLLGTAQGRTVWMGWDGDRAWSHPYYLDADTEPHEMRHPIDLSASLRRILTEKPWPMFSIEEDAGRWHFRWSDGRYLQLEPLPLDGSMKETWDRGTSHDPEFHFKELSLENILEFDPIFKISGMWSDDPEQFKQRVRKRVEETLSVKLSERVALPVRSMFEALKGAMVYGFYFRPIFSLASSQCHFIEDAALYHRCKQLGIDPPDDYTRRVNRLVEAGVIPKYELFLWRTKENLRNYAAHRTEHSMMWPFNDLYKIKLLAWDLERLYTPIFGSKCANHTI